MTRTKCQQYKALWAAQLGAFYFLVEPTADRGSIETLHMQYYILGAEGLWCFQLCLGSLLWFLKHVSFRSTYRLFQIAYEGDSQLLCTLTFWQKVDFLIRLIVMCVRPRNYTVCEFSTFCRLGRFWWYWNFCNPIFTLFFYVLMDKKVQN